jgi:hypothetical protein
MFAPKPVTFALSAVGFLAIGAPLSAQVPLRTRATADRPRLIAVAAAPTGLQIAQSGPAVVVSWQPVTEQAGYRVYRAPDQTSFAELTPAPIAATSFPDSTSTAGSTYHYRVAAEYPDGRVGMSDPIAFTVPLALSKQVPMANADISRRVAVMPPGQPPAGLTAVPAPTSVALGWSALLNVNGYRIERSPAQSGQWTTVATVPTLVFTDTGLDPDVAVQYRVTAEYADGRQGTSNPISTRTTRPVNPANLRATVVTRVINAQITPTWNASSVSSGDVTLTWNPVPGAAYYEVSGTGLSIPKSVPAATYTIAEIPPGLAQYGVVAYFLNGTRRYGDAANPARVEARVGPPPVTEFTGESHVNPSARVTLRWLDSHGAPRFKLFRADAEQGPYRELTNPHWLTTGMVIDTNPARGRPYFYKLASIFPSGPIAMTAPIRVDIPPQVVINNFRGTSPAPNTVRLSWDPVPGAVEFSILRGYATGTMSWIERYGGTMKLLGDATGYTVVEGRGYTYRYSVCVWTSNQDSACSGTISVPVPN